MFLILFVLVLRSWRKTKSQNKIIENQKSDIESQKSKLEESHKEITDSINYAKNIQDALMTSSEYIKDALPESFVFFLPKDVVSGITTGFISFLKMKFFSLLRIVQDMVFQVHL